LLVTLFPLLGNLEKGSHMKHGRAHLPALGVFFLALLIRMLYNVVVARDYIPTFDAALYNRLARNLVERLCYCLYASTPNISRPPAWPFIMAVIYFFAGEHEWFVRLLYCFLGAGTCLLIYLWAKDLFGKRIAFWTGILAAIYPGLFIYDGWLYSESLFTFCLTFLAYSLYKVSYPSVTAKMSGKQRLPVILPFWQHLLRRHKWSILGGLFLGLAALTRPNGPILVALVGLWAVMVIRARVVSWKRALNSALVIIFVAAAMIVPWTYRNYSVSHAFVLVSTGMGDVLKGAYNDTVLQGDPAVRGMWRPPPHTLLGHDSSGYTPENDRLDTEQAFTWIRSHLSAMPYLLSIHLLNLWIPYVYAHGLPFEEFPDRLSSKIMLSLIPIMSLPIFVLAVGGLLATWKRWKYRLLVVYLALALTIADNIAFYSNMRFRAPIEPLLVLLAGGTLWWLSSNERGTLRYRLRKGR
jgi:4-amino-4-deoxy-L-arabinose transferase-like glycosyltransferase